MTIPALHNNKRASVELAMFGAPKDGWWWVKGAKWGDIPAIGG
jgi:hypothetical protein